jgi:EmrB/QacA subfamily drug resistance transporter
VTEISKTNHKGIDYKWVALSNTTLSMLLAFINSSSVLLALPVIFRGLGVNPLAAGSSNLLLWLLMGYMLTTAVFVVAFGRLGDIFGRTRMYNLGFAVFTLGSLLCALTWSQGNAGAIELIAMRVVQGIGGAFLFANSAAILTDAFPENQRGMALGLNQVAGIAGSFLGIVVGGLLSEVGWRWVFLFNVPLGLLGTIWAYLTLRESGTKKREPIDWLGNITFAAGLVMLLVGIIYGINPSAHSSMSWTTPFVLGMVGGGIALLVAFLFIEQRVKAPMFRMNLFRIRAFAMGNLAGFLGSVARGGLQLMLIIWLQGIWLPLHGYDYQQTPLMAGIYLIPSSVGILLLGPLSGRLSDRFGARYFATGAMVLTAVGFALLLTLPVNFSYIWFALIIFLDGLSMGMFMAPNTAGIMNSLPPQHRGSGSGMRATLINIANPLSMAIIFTLMIIGLNASMPATLYQGLVQNGISSDVAHSLAGLPPVGYLFASFLGYNPLATLIPASVLQSLPAAQAATITSRSFFPQLIENAFHHGLMEVLIFSIVVCLIGALASWVRGGKYVYTEQNV